MSDIITCGFTRPYTRGGVPSVTTVQGILDKHLEWAAARETALFAVHHQEEWAHLEPDAQVDTLRKHFRGVWDGRAEMGSWVHRANASWIRGEDVDCPAVASGYVDGLERFWIDFQPETVAYEFVVRHVDRSNGYIGQADWIARIDGETWLLDLKTTAEQDPKKAVYADSWRLQLAAYRGAEQIVNYEADPDGKAVETGTQKNIPVAKCGVIHLRGDGQYTLYRVQAGGSEYTRFLQLVGLYRWVTKESKDPAPEIVEAAEREAVA